MSTQKVLPVTSGPRVAPTLRAHADVLEEGAAVTLDDPNVRVRVLPIDRCR